MTLRDDAASRMIAELHRLAKAEADGVPSARSTLARLHRALGRTPAEAPEATQVIGRFLGNDPRPARERAFYLIAALCAGYHEPAIWSAEEQVSLGTSWRRLADSLGEARQDAVERRFVALLNAHVEELDVHLRHAVRLLASAGLPIAWERLLGHVLWWDHPDRWVQHSWARDFWAPPQGKANRSSTDDGVVTPDAADVSALGAVQ